jgi:hypothetical protein
LEFGDLDRGMFGACSEQAAISSGRNAISSVVSSFVSSLDFVFNRSNPNFRKPAQHRVTSRAMAYHKWTWCESLPRRMRGRFYD